MSKRSIAATSAALLFALCGPAVAQIAEAQALFDRGVEQMKADATREACASFEASNRVEPRAGTLIWLGDCRAKQQQLASAWSAYKDALTLVKDPKKREAAQQRAAELEPRLSYLTIHTADPRISITRNGEQIDALLWNRTLPIDGGVYTIVATAPGHEQWEKTITIGLERDTQAIDIPALAPIAIAPPPASATPEVPSRWTSRRKLAAGIAGVSALSAATGIVLGVLADRKEEEAYALCPSKAAPCSDAAAADALLRAGQHRALGANISYGIAAAGVITATALWFTGAPESVAIVPAVAPGESGVAVVGRF